MKRFTCDDSLTALLYPSQGEVNPKDNSGYSREFQAMLDGLDEEDSINEESGGQSSTDKKRRLSVHQVKSLEKIFEVDNKLEPERKLKVAQELGLQPRQVAIWFQNRRARWKTKQLEREYSFLKGSYDSLKLNFHKLEQEKENLTSQLKELKEKVSEKETRKTDDELQNKEKTLFWGSQNNVSNSIELCDGEHGGYKNLNLEQITGGGKDGSSDSDSSGVLNEDNANNVINGGSSSSQLVIPLSTAFTTTPPSFEFSSSTNYSQFLATSAKSYQHQHHHQQQQQVVKMEDHCLVTSSEESCNIFSVDQAPTLCWYFPDQRN